MKEDREKTRSRLIKGFHRKERTFRQGEKMEGREKRRSRGFVSSLPFHLTRNSFPFSITCKVSGWMDIGKKYSFSDSLSLFPFERKTERMKEQKRDGKE